MDWLESVSYLEIVNMREFITYYEIMELPFEEVDKLVGKRIKTVGTRAFEYVIELDEYFQMYSGFGTRYTICSIWFDNTYLECPSRLCVFVPGIDDCNFRADIKPSQQMYLSYLDEQVRMFLERTSYRKINVHALGDFLWTLSPESISYDWN